MCFCHIAHLLCHLYIGVQLQVQLHQGQSLSVQPGASLKRAVLSTP